MREAFKEGMPATFTAEEAGFPGQVILPNTGLWICDFTKPWVEQLCFNITDRIIRNTEGKFQAQSLGEDWGLGVWAAGMGLRVKATTRIRLYHKGGFDYPAAPWGKWHEDEDEGQAFRPLRQMQDWLAPGKEEKVMELSQIRERIESLQVGLAQLEKQATEIESTRHATSGAIQEAQYWLKVLLAEKVAPTPPPTENKEPSAMGG